MSGGIRGRLATWARRQEIQGVSRAGLIFREAPALALRKLVGGVRGTMNQLLTTLYRDSYGRQLHAAFEQAGDEPWVVTAVPGLLHYLVPCLALARRATSVILLHNGTPSWERQVLAERFPELPVVRLRPLPGSMLAHGAVIDLLLQHADRFVGLLDPDLFAFDSSVFARLRLAPGEVAAGAFGVTNVQTGLRFPTTHLLALDAAGLRQLMTRHDIDSRIRRRTPIRLAPLLAEIGIGDGNYVKPHLSFYDPLNLLLAVARAEGDRLRVLDCDDEQALHVGGVSYVGRSDALDYFAGCLLALPWASGFAERYAGRLTPEQLDRLRQRLVRLGGESVALRVERCVELLGSVVDDEG